MKALRPPRDRVEWEKLTALIGAVSITGRIDGCRPQSLLLVGPPSSGKSALIERYHPPLGSSHNRHMTFLTSISQMGVRQILERQVPTVTHLVVPEFQALTLRKSQVWDTFMGIMLPAMEEGVSDYYNGATRESYNGARLGLITSVTNKAFADLHDQLYTTGFLSRMLVVYLNRTPEDALLARQLYNAGDHSELDKVYVTLPTRPVKVRLAPRLANEIDRYAYGIAPQEVHRVGNRFQAIVRAVAWLDGRDEVSPEHWSFLRSCESLWQEAR